MAKYPKGKVIIDDRLRDRHLLPCRDGISRMVELETIFILLDKSKKKRAKERQEENKKTIEERVEDGLNFYNCILYVIFKPFVNVLYKMIPIKDKYNQF